jgi:hypothetical protein
MEMPAEIDLTKKLDKQTDNFLRDLELKINIKIFNH